MTGDLGVRVGRNIRAAREEHHWNQRRLADEIKVVLPSSAASNQAVSEWERGIRTPSDRYMQALSEVLERDVGWFYESREPGQTPDPFGAREDAPAGDRDDSSIQLDRIEEKLDALLNLAELLQPVLVSRLPAAGPLPEPPDELVRLLQEWRPSARSERRPPSIPEPERSGGNAS